MALSVVQDQHSDGASPRIAQAAEGAEMAHAGRCLAQAQRLGCLAVGELLEVAEQDDLAVNTVKIIEGHPETMLQLSP